MRPFRRIEDKRGVDDPGYVPAAGAPDDPYRPTGPPAPPAEPPRESHKLRWLVLAVFAIVAALYFNGNLDRPLYGIGLNYHECARNGLGATFCGGELTEYRERISNAKHEGEASQHKLEAEEAKSKQEAEAAQQKAERESSALLRKSEEQQREAEQRINESSEEV